MAYTLEQLSTKIDAIESKLDCFCDCPSEGPCEYNSGISFTEQTGGLQYKLVVSYIDPTVNINTQLINVASTTVQTPQEFLDTLNATYSPAMTFSLNEDGTVHLVADGFSAACFLQIITNQQLPNVTGGWTSANSVQFDVLEVISFDSHSQGYYNGEPWGSYYDPATGSSGYLPFSGDTEKLIITYQAAIPSSVVICVHLIQNGTDITGSPFVLNIPAAGTGTTEITGLTGLLDSTYPLEIQVTDGC